MSVLDELGGLLQQRGVGSLGVDLFLGSRPDTPDDCVTLYEYPGSPPEYIQDQMYPNQEAPSIQIMGRGRDYSLVRARVKRAWDILSAINGQTIGGTHYRYCRVTNSPGLIGRDGNDRVLIAFNAVAEKEVS